jgi:surface polysaccharide O-acyltransferase-like enzyme
VLEAHFIKNQTLKSMQNSRNYGLDILRVLSSYLVIQVHTGEFYYIGSNNAVQTGDGPFWVGLLNSIARTAVPLFVMISGYFLLPIKEEMTPFFKKRFTRVVVPFVIWCALYAIYGALRGQSTWAEAATNILHIPVNYGTEVGHLWYVYMLIGLYLFAPIISPWITSSNRKGMEFYLVIWAISLCLPYIHVIFPSVLGECFWNHTPLLYYFSGFLGYMILAAYIKKYMFDKNPTYTLLAILLIAVGYAITAGGFIARLNAPTVPDLELTWGFESINVAMMSMGIFLLLKNMPMPSSTSVVTRVLMDVSKLSYGIYLVHIMLLNFYYGLLNPMIEIVWIKIPIIAFSTFITSYLVIKLLAFLPKSKYIVG